MSDRVQAAEAGDFHTLAWDGFSFDAPRDWNLSYYDFSGPYASLRMEDDVGIRLQMEWRRSAAPMNLRTIQNRYAERARGIEALAVERQTIEAMPAGWTAIVYRMPDRRRLSTVFWLAPDARFFVFFRLHIDDDGFRFAEKTIRCIGASFTLHGGPLIPWAFYDVAFDLPRQLTLQRSRLEAGRKMMVFEWRLMRLFLWHFSLADLLLKGRSPQEWAAGFLNTYKAIRGPSFRVEGAEIRAVRRGHYPFGHYDEIGHWCFRWAVRCRAIPDKNAVLLAVFNYRSKGDLSLLDPLVAPPPLPRQEPGF